MVNEFERENIKQNLRNNELEGMQPVLDELYERSCNSENFTDLTEVIFSVNNIRLAVRNIKGNKGSTTEGTDGKTFNDIKNLSTEAVITKIRKTVLGRNGYQPKAVRRVEIPKENGKMRPLGIPSIWDRLIQQCILQILEPICEAKFSRYSHGFRTCHSAQHAIADVNYRINQSHMYYAIKVDIQGFFDNVNHSRLIRRLWALGIRDPKLIYIIRQILKADIQLEDGTLLKSIKGTPQGGIISPILANVVLDELDKWLERQWVNNPRASRYAKVTKEGKIHKGYSYKKMRKGNLKELYHVRYADDVIIFGKTYEECERILISVTNFLRRNLKLEVSQEKSQIVALKERSVEYLGFEIKAVAKGGGWIARSHICRKAIDRTKKNLIYQLDRISKARDGRHARQLIAQYNHKVLGFQNYYRYATMVNIDCSEIGRVINNALTIKLKKTNRKGRLNKEGRTLTRAEAKRFGVSKMLRYDKSCGEPIYPIAYVQCEYPMPLNNHICAFSEEGRYLIHKRKNVEELEWLAEVNQQSGERSIEYQNNKLGLYVNQRGKCAITRREFLSAEDIHCHHKVPVHMGGTDEYKNLIVIDEGIHRLIHAKRKDTINKLIKEYQLGKEQIKKINKLRLMCNLEIISDK